MKKLLIAFIAILSGGYVFLLGWVLDPIPFIDEALALAIFVKCMDSLGLNVRRFIPFMGKKAKTATKTGPQVVDV